MIPVIYQSYLKLNYMFIIIILEKMTKTTPINFWCQNSKQNLKHGANQRQNQDLIDIEKFSKFLWGPILYDLETRKFRK